MLKRSKSSKHILITTLILSTIFAVSVFALSTAVTKARTLPQNAKSATPIPGVGVIVRCPTCRPPKNTRTQTDAEGNFSLSDLAPGLYDIRLACEKCAGMDIGEAGVLLTLTGTTQGEFRKTISKRELVSGIEFSIEIARRNEHQKPTSGHVTLIK